MTDVTDPLAPVPEPTRAPAPQRPLIRPLAGLTAGNAVREALAGITLMAIAIPLNIGYAQSAACPPPPGSTRSSSRPRSTRSRSPPASSSPPPTQRRPRWSPAPLFFANATVFAQSVERAAQESGARHVVLDMEAVTDVDVTGAEAWESLLAALNRHNADLALSRVRPGIRDRLQHLRLLDGVRIFDTNREAIVALRTDTVPKGHAHGRD